MQGAVLQGPIHFSSDSGLHFLGVLVVHIECYDFFQQMLASDREPAPKAPRPGADYASVTQRQTVYSTANCITQRQTVYSSASCITQRQTALLNGKLFTQRRNAKDL